MLDVSTAPHPHQHGVPADKRSNTTPTGRIDLAVAILLGLAALTSGLTTWRSAVHGGHAETKYTMSTQATANANALQQNAQAAANSERVLYVGWVGALARGNPAGAKAIWNLMSLTTKETIKWWHQQPDYSRPASPFSSANPQWTTPRHVIEAREALNEASGKLGAANEDISRSHSLELIVALLSITFLTGGLTATIASDLAQRVLLGVSATFLVIAVIGLISLW